MKKYFIIVLAFLIFPIPIFATIDKNLYFGMKNNSQVRELQTFLIQKSFMQGYVTGNFYYGTLAGVKKYQSSKRISPTGYVGPQTRSAINAEMAVLQPAPATSPAGLSAPANAGAVFSGTLDLSPDPAFPSKNVSVPAVKVKFSDFKLKNSTNEPVLITSLRVDLSVNSDLYASNLYVNNLYISRQGSDSAVKQEVSHINIWDQNFVIEAGKEVNVSVYGDINSSLPKGYSVNTAMLAFGRSSITKTDLSTNLGSVVAGQYVTSALGILSAALEGSSIDKAFVAGQKIIAEKFKLSSSSEPFTISELKFTVPDSGGFSLISRAGLVNDKSGAILNKRDGFLSKIDGSNVISFTGLDIKIPRDGSESIQITYDLFPVSSPENSGKDISPTLVYIKASDGRGNISTQDIQVKGGKVFAFKSLPIFTAESLPVSSVTAGSSADLYKFKISASTAGDISFKQIRFTINLVDTYTLLSQKEAVPYLNNFSLFKDGRDYSGSASLGYIVNNNYLSVSGANGVGAGINTVILTFNREETVPAGGSVNFVLRAKFNNFFGASAQQSDSLSIYIASDDLPSTGNSLRCIFSPICGLSADPASVAVNNYNLIWSDKSAIGFPKHSDSNGASTKDWFNGFKVFGLPLTSQAISAK